jgi:GAF domain-containing protein
MTSDSALDTVDVPIDIAKARARRSDLIKLTRALEEANSKTEVYELVAKAAPRMLELARCTVAEPDKNSPTFQILVLEGLGVLMSRGTRMLLPGTSVGEALDTGNTIATSEHPLDTFGDWRHLKSMGLVHFICIPLKVADQTVATLSFGAPKSRPFDSVDRYFADELGELVSKSLSALM